jgi:aspartate 1-decarboxylase
MNITLLKSKIHRAIVTETDLHYIGSITIDRDIMDACGLLPHEQVDVFNINTGGRFTTYVIEGERGSGRIGINGAAARLAETGDPVIVCAYAQMSEEEAREFGPSVVQMDENNRIV